MQIILMHSVSYPWSTCWIWRHKIHFEGSGQVRRGVDQWAELPRTSSPQDGDGGHEWPWPGWEIKFNLRWTACSSSWRPWRATWPGLARAISDFQFTGWSFKELGVLEFHECFYQLTNIWFRFVINSYLRARLEKIESQVWHYTGPGEAGSRMTQV